MVRFEIRFFTTFFLSLAIHSSSRLLRPSGGQLPGWINSLFAAHWKLTLTFLEILSQAWPEILKSRNALDPAARRNALLRRRAALWRERPPTHPVIAAGSTGSIPATRELLATIAQLPQGAVVLSGLDRHLDDAQWQALEQPHPQYGLRELLAALDIEPRRWRVASTGRGRRQHRPRRHVVAGIAPGR